MWIATFQPPYNLICCDVGSMSSLFVSHHFQWQTNADLVLCQTVINKFSHKNLSSFSLIAEFNRLSQD